MNKLSIYLSIISIKAIGLRSKVTWQVIIQVLHVLLGKLYLFPLTFSTSLKAMQGYQYIHQLRFFSKYKWCISMSINIFGSMLSSINGERYASYSWKKRSINLVLIWYKLKFDKCLSFLNFAKIWLHMASENSPRESKNIWHKHDKTS